MPQQTEITQFIFGQPLTRGEQKQSEPGWVITLPRPHCAIRLPPRLGRYAASIPSKVEDVVDGSVSILRKRWADRADLNAAFCALVAAPPDASSLHDCSSGASVRGDRPAA